MAAPPQADWNGRALGRRCTVARRATRTRESRSAAGSCRTGPSELGRDSIDFRRRLACGLRPRGADLCEKGTQLHQLRRRCRTHKELYDQVSARFQGSLREAENTIHQLLGLCLVTGSHAREFWGEIGQDDIRGPLAGHQEAILDLRVPDVTDHYHRVGCRQRLEVLYVDRDHSSPRPDVL